MVTESQPSSLHGFVRPSQSPDRTMTGSPLRRLQEFAVVLDDGLALFASDEGGESGGLPVRVQSKTAL